MQTFVLHLPGLSNHCAQALQWQRTVVQAGLAFSSPGCKLRALQLADLPTSLSKLHRAASAAAACVAAFPQYHQQLQARRAWAS